MKFGSLSLSGAQTLGRCDRPVVAVLFGWLGLSGAQTLGRAAASRTNGVWVCPADACQTPDACRFST